MSFLCPIKPLLVLFAVFSLFAPLLPWYHLVSFAPRLIKLLSSTPRTLLRLVAQHVFRLTPIHKQHYLCQHIHYLVTLSIRVTAAVALAQPVVSVEDVAVCSDPRRALVHILGTACIKLGVLPMPLSCGSPQLP